MTEIIEGEAVDVTPTSAVVPVQQGVQTFDHGGGGLGRAVQAAH